MRAIDVDLGYRAGLIGRIVELHARYYSENWGFDRYFEAKVATELSEYISRYNEEKDRVFTLSIDGVIEGSLVIDGSSEEKNIAHLRWFILSDKLRGQGAGDKLMKEAMEFCTATEFDGAFLWTFQGLSPARRLYEKYGFSLIQEKIGDQWGIAVTEQLFRK